jgi:hypothetical protein
MYKTTQQEPAFETECKIIIKGPKRTGLEFSKRAVNEKEFGHMNDFQTYENITLKSVSEFMKAKKLSMKEIKLVKQVKDMKVFLGRVRQLKEELGGV